MGSRQWESILTQSEGRSREVLCWELVLGHRFACLQWRVDKLITQQSSQANITVLEMVQAVQIMEMTLKLVEILHVLHDGFK